MAVAGVWHCLVLFGRQSSSCCRQIIYRYTRSLRIRRRIPVRTDQILLVQEMSGSSASNVLNTDMDTGLKPDKDA